MGREEVIEPQPTVTGTPPTMTTSISPDGMEKSRHDGRGRGGRDRSRPTSAHVRPSILRTRLYANLFRMLNTVPRPGCLRTNPGNLKGWPCGQESQVQLGSGGRSPAVLEARDEPCRHALAGQRVGQR